MSGAEFDTSPPWSELDCDGSSPTEEGSEVRIADGPLEGFEGIIIDRRASGRFLIRVCKGVFIETSLVEFKPPEDQHDSPHVVES